MSNPLFPKLDEIVIDPVELLDPSTPTADTLSEESLATTLKVLTAAKRSADLFTVATYLKLADATSNEVSLTTTISSHLEIARAVIQTILEKWASRNLEPSDPNKTQSQVSDLDLIAEITKVLDEYGRAQSQFPADYVPILDMIRNAKLANREN